MTQSKNHRIRFITVLVLLLLFTIFAVQNAAIVSIHFLLWSFSAPRSLMIVAVLLIGVAIGWIWSEHLHHLRNSHQAATKK